MKILITTVIVSALCLAQTFTRDNLLGKWEHNGKGIRYRFEFLKNDSCYYTIFSKNEDTLFLKGIYRLSGKTLGIRIGEFEKYDDFEIVSLTRKNLELKQDGEILSHKKIK